MKTELYKAGFDATAPKCVDSITIEWLDDESPDASYLGEYSNEATSPAAIDRKERGDMGRGEFRYFNPAMTGDETGNPDSPEQDYQRMESLNRGDWSFLGCRAVAEVSYPCGNGSRRLQRFTSGGLWGIESDNDASYKAEVEQGQLDELKEHLAQFGIEWPELEHAHA